MKSLIFLIISALFSSILQANCVDIKKRYGPEWIQNFIEVPLEHGNPHSPKIKISYYHKGEIDFKKETVLFFNGGPTIEGHIVLSTLGKNEHLKNVNMIFMDQRGTGCSSPFVENKLSYFASDSIVQDADILRQKIVGFKKWSIFGQSYGGLISFRYLELFPNNLKRATIHGMALPDSGKYFFEMREFEIQKRTPELLSFTNGKDKSLGELFDLLGKNDIFNQACIELPNTAAKKFCGQNIKTALYMIAGFKSFWPFIYDSIDRFVYLSESKPELLEKEVISFSKRYLLRFKDDLQLKALSIISFREAFIGEGYFSSEMEDEHEISEKRFRHLFIPRSNLDGIQINPINKKLVKDNIKKFSIDVGYFAGEYDTFIPLALVEETARELDIVNRLKIFKETGHEGYDHEVEVLNHITKSQIENQTCLQLIHSVFKMN